MRTLAFGLVVVCGLGLGPSAGAREPQTPIDGILKIVNDDIVTMFDVRQAVRLKLFGPAPLSEAALVEKLVDRRLMLLEVASSPPKDPPAQRLVDQRRQWEASLGPGADVSALLASAGMTEKALEGWLLDSARIDALVGQMFGATTIPTHAELLAYYQAHVGDYTRNLVVQEFASPAVQADIRQKLTAANQARAVAGWVQSLRRRADIRDPIKRSLPPGLED
jgi:hypothetical protein